MKILFRYYLLTTIIVFPWTSFSQNTQEFKDTIIENSTFKIIKRFGNNKVKQVKQIIQPNQIDTLIIVSKKNGEHIKFHRNGKVSWRKFYFNNKIDIDKSHYRFLGLRFGYWCNKISCTCGYYYLGIWNKKKPWRRYQPSF